MNDGHNQSLHTKVCINLYSLSMLDSATIGGDWRLQMVITGSKIWSWCLKEKDENKAAGRYMTMNLKNSKKQRDLPEIM